jgi:pimeloyl-ACP methyl ester carboxylesterase
MSPEPRPVILIGHSIGGMTIQTLARDMPDLIRRRVVGVILLNTTYTNPLHTMVLSRLALALRKPVLEPVFKLAIALKPLAWIGAWQGYLNGTAHIANRLQFGTSVTRSQLEHTTLLGTRNPPDGLAKGNLAMFDWDATNAIENIECPVLIIGGEMDIVTKIEASRDLSRHKPTSVLESVSSANHMGFLERAHHYNTLITAFVAERAAALKATT